MNNSFAVVSPTARTTNATTTTDVAMTTDRGNVAGRTEVFDVVNGGYRLVGVGARIGFSQRMRPSRVGRRCSSTSARVLGSQANPAHGIPVLRANTSAWRR